MKYIQCIDDLQHLKTFVCQELKNHGIKLPKKKTRTRNDSLELNRNIFGNHLCLLPQVDVTHCGPVPKFLYDASQVLEQHATTEGLFRKSGSVARQKELKQSIEDGQDISSANPLDLASLVKQFFRELPDPLLTSRQHDTFLKAFSLEEETARQGAVLLLCLLLPWHHLSTLRFIMMFLRKISAHAEQNKMDVQNLAVCLAPNILHANTKSDKMNSTESKLLQIQTNIVQLLIDSADQIGMVSDSLVEQCHLMSTCFPEEDELDTVGEVILHNDSKNSKKTKKKRSGSFQGLMSNLSTSFSKWRKEARHNASSVSERSTYSYTSHSEKSSMMLPGGGDLHELLDYDAMTPKMLRKRKADEECVPFSASKKQAILKNMPAMSTLGGTPFTPAMRRGMRGQEVIDTPNIKFSNGSDAVFSATPRMRKSPGKAGCFSPKTPKNGMRKTMRGFLKRLSGGNVQGSGSDDKDYVQRIEMNSSRRKSGMFRRHKKTPSSPARLITPLLRQQARTDSESDLMSSEDPATPLHAQMSDKLLVQRLSQDLQSESATPVSVKNHRRRYSEGAGNLRRGKPNTIKTGLPSPAKRRSTDNRFVSPEKNKMDSVPSTLDTSPILKEGNASPMAMVTSQMEVTDMDETSGQLSRQESTSSMTSLGLADQTNIESDHDRAFISESMLDSPEIDSLARKRSCTSLLYTSTTNNTPEGAFKKPMAVDTMKPPILQQKVANKLNQSGVSDASDTSAYTVIHNGQPILKSKLASHSENVSSVAEKRTLKKTHSQRTESLDSAIDMCGSESQLTKCTSLQSVKSVDSGLSMGERMATGSDVNRKKYTQSVSDGGDSVQKLSLDASHSTPGCQDTDESFVFERQASIRISKNMRMMLTKAGAVSEAQLSKAALSASLESLSQPSFSTNSFDSEPSEGGDMESITDGKDSQEVAERRASPYRFHNSHLRRRMGSPVRIPTIFAKADQEASKYRELAHAALHTSPRPGVKKPCLPISTDMVNVMKARARLQLCDDSPEFNDPSAGSTPSRLLHKLKYNTVDISSDSRDNIENNPTSHCTPRIKEGLIPTKRMAQRQTVEHADLKTSCRTPVKPVKRLQGPSPSGKFYKSPKKPVLIKERR